MDAELVTKSMIEDIVEADLYTDACRAAERVIDGGEDLDAVTCDMNLNSLQVLAVKDCRALHVAAASIRTRETE